MQPSWATQDETLVFGSDHDFAPYEYLDKDGKPIGFNIDMMQALAEIMGTRIELRLGPWSVIRDEFEHAGTVDISDMYETAERRNLFEFAQPFDIAYDEIFVRKETPAACVFGRMAGKSVIVQRAASTHEYVLASEPLANIILVDSEPDALRMLASGFYDCAIVTRISGRLAIKHHQLNNLVASGGPIRPRNYALVVRKGETVLRDRLNEALQVLKKTGQYQQIYNKWFGQPEPLSRVEKFLREYGLLLLAAMTLVITVVFSWTRILNRQVTLRTKALALSEMRWRELFENANDVIFVIEPGTGRILDANRLATARYGYSHNELVCMHAHNMGPGENISRTNLGMEKLGEAGNAMFEHIHQHKDGSLFPVEISARVIELSGKTVIECFVRDISERKSAEREREQLLDELARRNTEMENFVYTISHDLKAPLITIEGFARLLEKYLVRGDVEMSKDSLLEIHKATESMQRLIEDLLNLSRTGQLLGEQVPVDLAELFEEAKSHLQIQIANSEAQVICNGPLPMIRADRQRFMQVLQNLLDNAIKFRRPDVLPMIEFGAVRGEHDLRLYLKDNGVGIPERYQEKVFGLFQRLDTRVPGTGVGLAIAKRIVEIGGGHIWVESNEVSGCTCWIKLPLSVMVADIDVHDLQSHHTSGGEQS